MAQRAIQSQVRVSSTLIIKMQLPTDISCLNGIQIVFRIFIGTGLRLAATALASVVSAPAAAPTTPAPAALMASPPAYASDIHANPIYRRKAVTRICV